MPGGGKLTIRLEIGDDHTVAIYFTDNGSGIPEAILSRLGEPFFTTKEKGNGLGFMISKNDRGPQGAGSRVQQASGGNNHKGYPAA